MFSTFEIVELADESDNDYAVEIQASECKFGILLTEDELHAIGCEMISTVEEDGFDGHGGKSVEDILNEEADQ